MKGVRKHSTGARDAALRRLSSANRWLIAGSVALTAIISEVAAQAFPGKKLATTGVASHARGAPRSTPSRSPEEFHPPEQPPQASGESQSPEASPPASESAPPSSESAPPAEAPAQPAPESSAESPPVVSGGS